MAVRENIKTVAEVAEILGIEVEAARGLVKFLEATGSATFRGKRPTESGRGQGQNVYTLVDDLAGPLAKVAKKLAAS